MPLNKLPTVSSSTVPPLRCRPQQLVKRPLTPTDTAHPLQQKVSDRLTPSPTHQPKPPTDGLEPSPRASEGLSASVCSAVDRITHTKTTPTTNDTPPSAATATTRPCGASAVAAP